MTTTTTNRPSASSVRVLARHRSRMTMVGVLLAVMGGLTAWLAYTQATQGEQVIATARYVAYGATITEADLRPVEIPQGSTLRVTAWSEHATLIGQVATTDLTPDTLVTPNAASAARLPARGEAIVGLPVAAGRLPATGLLPRDVVEIVEPATTPTELRATVLAVGDPDAAGRRTVDLIIPATAVDDVAAAAAAAGNDNTLLVLLGSGG